MMSFLSFLQSESSPEAPERGGLSAEPGPQAEVSVMGETLEDMSLSSSSSLDRNDTSQEYMDDFDNLGTRQTRLRPSAPAGRAVFIQLRELERVKNENKED